ncbi:hypothetical protein [Pajaroellobacter abortibovis]|uniref:Uncharacterized protein n=1 Tax=Pajaroellobacter abortibovis TaxID=1882918 RepID=A0A1L6MYW3_9BACT|nr:hypothetical protein [Pajaroellobacter abortibovis]APS00781.1 hypothetical protein BCY86_08895 [Pajaroellobacter abortibovis]
MKWNSGNLITEVDIPVLLTGQRIVIEHSPDSPEVKKIPATRLVPPSLTLADRALIGACRNHGLCIDENAPEINITHA